MNCSSQADREKSKDIFSQAKTYSQFLDVWSRFYINEICIPFYFDNFIGGEDNKYTTMKMGEKFREITKHGLIPVNFQVNSLKDGQKAYIILFATEAVCNIITEYINRYPGFVAFYQNSKEGNDINGLFVTYDPNKEQAKKTMKTGVFFGNPFSVVGVSSGQLDFIREWLPEPLLNVISNENFREITIIDTIPTEKSDRILNLLLNVLRDNSNAVNNERERLNML